MGTASSLDSGRRKVGKYVIFTDLDNTLGSGSYGIVYKGKHTVTKENVAAKYCQWEREFVTEETHKEANIMINIPKHENILEILDYITVDTVEDNTEYLELWIITELCPLKNLQKFARSKALTVPQKVDIALQCARGVHHLHQQEPVIIHRDIKLENLLVSGTDTRPQIKVGDFGVSRAFESIRTQSACKMTATGTDRYMAPELFSQLEDDETPKYNASIDTYSLGVSFATLLDAQAGSPVKVPTVNDVPIGRFMYRNKTADVLSLIQKPSDSDDVTAVKQIIAQMMKFDPKERLSLAKVIEKLSGLLPAHGDVWKTEEASGGPVDVRPRHKPRGSAEGPVKAEGSNRPRESAPAPAPVTTPPAPVTTSPAPAVPGAMTLRKVSSTVLPVRGVANLTFGHDNFIVGFKDDPELYFFEFKANKYQLKWKKPIPEGLTYDDYNHVSPSKDIYLQGFCDKVWLFTEDLQLRRAIPSPGMIIGLLSDGEHCVVSDEASPGTETSSVRLFISPASSPSEVRHSLDVPEDGAYTRQDELYACGLMDGPVAVISRNKTFLDIYNKEGRHVRLTPLSAGAGIPGCSQTHILVPLRRKPYICVYDWSGHLQQTLGPAELGLSTDDRGFAVSPVWSGKFCYWAASPKKEVHTYEIV